MGRLKKGLTEKEEKEEMDKKRKEGRKERGWSKIRFASNDGDLRYSSFSVSIQQLSTVANNSVVLLRSSRKETLINK
jgi:hypothetical protein